MTLTGPSNVWFGIGFNGTDMANTYSIICSDAVYCFEQILAYGATGQLLSKQHISTISDVRQNGVRTVQLSRKQIITADDDANNYANIFDFPSFPLNLPIIYSYGTNNIFATNASHMANADKCSLMFTNLTNRHNLTASKKLFGNVDQTIQMEIFPDLNQMEIVLNGPSSVWYGVGFGSAQMNNTYAIIIDTDGSVAEYILGPGLPGKKLSTQSLVVKDNIASNGIRKVKLNRAISVLDSKAYTFPVAPSNISIIASYGTSAQLPYNQSSHMANATSSILNFHPFNASGNGNDTNSSSICKPGIVKYGIDGNVGDGFDIGLYIYCEQKTIQLSVKYDNYLPNWFGIVFDTKMVPSPNSTIFTTGKPSETQRPLGLYAYDLSSYSTSGVVYRAERNWRKVSQSIVGKSVSLVYEQDLDNTKWSTSTGSISFRYAWGSSAQETKLGPHTSTSYSKVWTFDLANGAISSSGTDTLKIIHGIVMTVAWSLLVTIGVFASRFRLFLFQRIADKAMWFYVHRGIQYFAVLCVLIAFGMAVYFIQEDGTAHFSNTHECLGLSVTILAFLQPINAYLRPHAAKKGLDKSIGRWAWEITHKSFGYVTWILSQVAIYFGIQQLTTDDIYIRALFIYDGVVIGLFGILWVYNTFCFIPSVATKRLLKHKPPNHAGYLSTPPIGSPAQNSMQRPSASQHSPVGDIQVDKSTLSDKSDKSESA